MVLAKGGELVRDLPKVLTGPGGKRIYALLVRIKGQLYIVEAKTKLHRWPPEERASLLVKEDVEWPLSVDRDAAVGVHGGGRAGVRARPADRGGERPGAQRQHPDHQRDGDHALGGPTGAVPAGRVRADPAGDRPEGQRPRLRLRRGWRPDRPLRRAPRAPGGAGPDVGVDTFPLQGLQVLLRAMARIGRRGSPPAGTPHRVSSDACPSVSWAAGCSSRCSPLGGGGGR